MRDRKAWRQGECLAACRLCVFGIAGGAQRMAEIGMRLGLIGSKRRSTAKRRDGFVEPPLFAKRRAEIVVRLVVIGTQHQHAAVASLGLGCPAGLAQQIAELVMGLY